MTSGHATFNWHTQRTLCQAVEGVFTAFCCFSATARDGLEKPRAVRSHEGNINVAGGHSALDRLHAFPSLMSLPDRAKTVADHAVADSQRARNPIALRESIVLD